MSEASVRERLRQVGYEFIQAEARLSNIGASLRPDVLAWAADAEGVLVPWAVVEIKPGLKSQPPQAALPQLARSRDLLGTVEHYVVMDGQWYRANSGLRSLSPVDGPEPPPYGGRGEITDVDLATSIIAERLWRWADYRRGHADASEILYSAEPFLASEDTRAPWAAWEPGIPVDLLPASREVLWAARRHAILLHVRHGRSRDQLEYTSHPVIARAVAALALDGQDREVLDPFCGVGSFLWDAIDHASEYGQHLDAVIGYDINQRAVELAQALGRDAPFPVEIRRGDAFTASLPSVTCVVSSPPVSLRLSEPYALLDGSTTRDGDFAAIDKAVRSLAPEGRAVLHVPEGVTFRRNGEQLRRYLANQYHVAAVIGCPTGAFAGTGTRSALLVIDNSAPGDTFVAQLGEDWETQLAPGGAAFDAAMRHVNGVSA